MQDELSCYVEIRIRRRGRDVVCIKATASRYSSYVCLLDIDLLKQRLQAVADGKEITTATSASVSSSERDLRSCRTT